MSSSDTYQHRQTFEGDVKLGDGIFHQIKHGATLKTNHTNITEQDIIDTLTVFSGGKLNNSETKNHGKNI